MAPALLAIGRRPYIWAIVGLGVALQEERARLQAHVASKLQDDAMQVGL